MARIILVLLLASACGCASGQSVSSPVPSPDAGEDMCEYCDGPQYPIGGGDIECLGTYKYYACSSLPHPDASH